MFCVHCGKEIADQSEFCPYCGQKIASDSGNEQNAGSGSSQTTGTTTFTQDAQGMFDNVQGKMEEKLGVSDSRPITHPFQKLGGFLAVLTYLYLLIGIYDAYRVLRLLLGGMKGGFIPLISNAVGVFICIKMFVMIQKKDTEFVHFYEMVKVILFGIQIVGSVLTTIFFAITLGSYAGLSIGIFWGFMLPALLFGVLGFFLIMLYFDKSVRVRTYFGTDEYLKKSMFLKNTAYPQPAVEDR